MIFPSASMCFRKSAGLGLGLLLVLSTGCGEKSAGDAAAGGGRGGRGGRGGGSGAAPVVVAQAQRKVVPLIVDAIGAVEPIRTATIRAQVTGSLFKIDIDEGQDVKEGDLLFELDARPFQNALNSALADQEKINVQLQTARAQVERYRTLSAESMVSKEQFQQILDNERALAAQAESSKSAVANARLQLEYCSIRAPINGRTGNLNVHVGDLVRANDSGALITINQLSPIYVTFGVPQQYLAAFTRYRAAGTLAVAAVPPGGEDQPEAGALTFIDNTVDSTTGTIKLKASFPNTGHRLWPGQFVTAGVTLAAPEALTVPTAAVQNSQTGQHVFVIDANHNAELREVVVERTFENDSVITKGVSAGETIVVDGQLRVIPGRPVEIKQPDAPTIGDGNRGGDAKGQDQGHAKGKGKKSAT
jgi:membrane fusion protein, multidrug efflux system